MKRLFDRMRPMTVVAACATFLFLPQLPTRAAGSQTLAGHVPRAISRLQPIAPLDGATPLKLAIGLPLRDKVGLTNLLQEIYDPTSPNYHHYLTPAQFAARFGPTEADYQAVSAFATAHHLVVTGTNSNRMILDVQGDTSDIEKVFHVSLHVYHHPTEDRTFFAPDQEPSIDLSVPVQHISGLDNYMLPHPNYIATPISQLPTNRPALGSGAGGTYLGTDFRAAYVPGVSLTGSGQKVALVEFDTYYPTDITQYETNAGLAAIPLTNVTVDGFSSSPGGDNGEVALDIEMCVSMAPGLSQILVYEAPNFSVSSIVDDILNKIATDDLANQVSASWSYAIDSTTEQIYLQMAAQGQSFFNAAGDSGAYPPGDVPTPSDDPSITIVGGTTLSTASPGGPWQSETVWSWFTQGIGDGAGSGGISTTYALPTWQQGISMVNNQGSTTFRNLPDVAMTADNIFVVADDGVPQSVGGTSAATPLWAAFTALVNEQAASIGKSPMGFLNPAIYTICKGPLYSGAFHDIVTGNNTNYVSPQLFYAVPGYDLCTGWGTPTGSNLINALAPLVLSPVLAVVTNTISGGNGNGTIDFDECNNLTVVLTNEGNAIATDIEATLISTTPGVIVAQGSSSYQNLLPKASAVNLTPFVISTEPNFVCGTPVNLTLIIKTAQVVETNYLDLTSGVIGSPVNLTNSTVMVVPPNNYLGISSPVQVSGLESVGKITVSVSLDTLYDEGIFLQLISPNGTAVTLSQNNGGGGANYGTSCSPGSETTFDDAGTVPITLASPPYVGTFAPQQALSTYNLMSGTNLNGTWQLQVIDEFPDDTAQLNCWTLTIYPEVCTDGGGECPGSDLSITMSATPNPVIIGSNLVFNMTVSNAGPASAANVVVSQSLPAGLDFITATNSQGTATQAGTNVNFTIGEIPVGGTATISSVTLPTVVGTITSTATVNSPAPDSNPANNTASSTVVVSEPTADLAVSISASPTVLLQGQLLTYTISVTNNGPFTATEVTLNNTLPPNVNFVSASTTQGTVYGSGTSALLGTIDPGSNVIVTIVVSPTVTGNITAQTTVTLSPTETDPISYNNTASVTTTVGPAADLSVSAFATPSPVVSGSNITYIITISNQGPSAATGVTLSQSLPSGTTFVSSSQAGAVVSNNAIDWPATSVSSGSSYIISNVIKAPTLLAGVRTDSLFSTISVFGQPGDPNTNNNVVTLQTIAEPPTVTVTPAGAILLSGNVQQNDGSVHPGETVTVQFALQNTGTVPTTNLVATLQDSGGVTLASGPQTYGVLSPGAPPTSEQFSFTANSTNGGTVIATLQLQDGSANLGTVIFDFVMPVVKTFSNTNFISIPSQLYIPNPDSGPANPYPSDITVSGITNDISKITVTISNMVHAYPHDVGMLLVGPTGADSVLMSAAGEYSAMTNPVTITFDQSASVAIPAEGQIVSGTYQPAEYNTSDYYPSNAPVGPYNANLAVFGNVVPNGSWALYIYDSAAGDAGAISNGWSLTLTAITPVNQTADLAATISASANSVTLGGTITYLLGVTNNGPDTANAFVTNVLPAGLTFASAELPVGVTNIQSGQTNIYSVSALVWGSGVVITNQVTVTAGGLLTNSITVGSSILDGNLGNNTASVVTSINMPLADLGAGLIVSPNFAIVSSNLVFTLYATNYGPGTALGVVGNFGLSGLQIVSASPSQGFCVTNGGILQCNLGTIPAGDIATVMLTAIPLSSGTVTNVWSLTTSSSDTNSSNNTVTNIINVTYPRPEIVAGPATLLVQNTTTPNGAINANETVTVAFTLTNIGTASTTNLIATLQSTGGITPTTTTMSYGAIPAGGSAARSYTFVAQGTPGSTIVATLALVDGTFSLGTVSNTFLIPITASYNNPATITINEFGPASPYPSQIQVSGLTNLLVSKVTASLYGFAHTWPSDVNVLLSSPSGQELILMGHTGGANGVTNINLTFDDAATQPLTTNTLVSGTYLPTDISPIDTFPGVAPATGTSLGVFNGSNPNGVWSLYVYDDKEGDGGVIANGWSLALTAVQTVNPAALLEAGMISTPNPVYGGDYLDYQITITNMGPDAATSVVLTDTLPAGVTVASVSLSQGSNVVSSGTVTCELGTLNVGAVATAVIQVIAGTAGNIVNTATVTTASTDLYLADSTVVNSTTVIPPPSSFLVAANTAGEVQLTLRGQPGQNYGVQVSTNLISWKTIATNTASPNGNFTFIATETNAPAQFYRAIRLPQ
jgi:uncharacterized repeat protein (TIGR01451 family)